jgi:hypothetical protein
MFIESRIVDRGYGVQSGDPALSANLVDPCRDPSLRVETARLAIPASMPRKITACTGYSAYQYTRPARPAASKIAVCRI